MNTSFARIVTRTTVCGLAVMVAAPLAASSTSFAGTSAATAFQALTVSDVLAVGPVERVDVSKRQIQVLGQLVVVPAAQSTGLADLLGQMVEVHGSVNSDGTFRTTKVSEITTFGFVPGATELYLKGAISEVDQVSAVASVGSLSIKYAEALHTLNNTSLAVGQIVSFSGVEYSGIAAFYANNGLIIGSAAPLAQTGTDGARSLAQTGTDGARSAAQTGTDGARSLAQTGTDGARSLAQTGTDGARSLAQTGTDGARSLAQTGTDGARSLAQTGTDGARSLAQTGTDGARSLAQTGTDGARSLAQTGTD